jgi:hypothetical protein
VEVAAAAVQRIPRHHCQATRCVQQSNNTTNDSAHPPSKQSSQARQAAPLRTASSTDAKFSLTKKLPLSADLGGPAQTNSMIQPRKRQRCCNRDCTFRRPSAGRARMQIGRAGSPATGAARCCPCSGLRLQMVTGDRGAPTAGRRGTSRRGQQSSSSGSGSREAVGASASEQHRGH